LRRPLIALALAIVALGWLLRSEDAYAERKLEREILAAVANPDRYVDIGVAMHVVVQDDAGQELLDGRPRLRILRTHRAGGILDTELGILVGPSRSPQVWYCSEDQEPVILHGDGETLGQLVYGSEGAGKSTAAAMWHYFRWLEHLGQFCEGGQVAPTRGRLKFVRDEMLRLFPQAWGRFLKAESVMLLADGTRIKFAAAKRQSGDGGSPLQGFNWWWCCGDEMQDMPGAHNDIESRGRASKAARYKQLRTATAKDHSSWRQLRDKLLAAPTLWTKRVMLGARSPFIDAAFWLAKRLTMDPREYARRVLAEDVGVELAVYYCWQRDRGLARRPVMAVDVTAAVLAGYESYTRPGARLVLVVGHDPGTIYNTSVVLRLLLVDGRPVWFVVGELQTKQTTAREHARQLRLYLADKFGVEDGVDTGKVAVFCDPHGKGESQTDYQTVYGAFQREGLDVFSPAPMSGRIKRTARVGMVNRLMYDGPLGVRLVVEVDRQNQPMAPVLVDALESLEKREGDDNPEGGQRKDATDKTHAPAALSYGLWPFEQEAVTEATQQRACRSVRRIAA
jgi:hypothetical protein